MEWQDSLERFINDFVKYNPLKIINQSLYDLLLEKADIRKELLINTSDLLLFSNSKLSDILNKIINIEFNNKWKDKVSYIPKWTFSIDKWTGEEIEDYDIELNESVDIFQEFLDIFEKNILLLDKEIQSILYKNYEQIFVKYNDLDIGFFYKNLYDKNKVFYDELIKLNNESKWTLLRNHLDVQNNNGIITIKFKNNSDIKIDLEISKQLWENKKWIVLFYVIFEVWKQEDFDTYKSKFEKILDTKIKKSFEENYKSKWNNFIKDILKIEYSISNKTNDYYDIYKI